MTHDVCGPGTIGVFKREFGTDAKVWDPDRPDPRSLHLHCRRTRQPQRVDILREFASEQGIKYFTTSPTERTLANPDYKGVCHIALSPRGSQPPWGNFCLVPILTPAMLVLLVVRDRYRQYRCRFIMGTGKLLIKVPATMRFVLTVKCLYLLAKDLIPNYWGYYVAGATYRQWNLLGKPFRTNDGRADDAVQYGDRGWW